MQVDARYRFDNFIVGSGNRLAVAAARAVADGPGAVYNPLFIYSGSGLGKTHLMGAIGNQVQQRQPDLVVEYVTLDDFVEQLHAAIGGGATEQFKQRYQRIDVLLVDDMQFLTGHRETQSELLRLLNAMQATGRQIVMTSDRPPSEIADVDERLITRLTGGLIVDVGAPDYETRIAILRAKCDERGVRFRPGVIEEIGRLEFKNVRELQGSLNRLIAFQTLGGEQIKPEDVLTILGDIADTRGHTPVRPTPIRGGEFDAFLSDIANVVTEQVESWKVRVSEAIAHWRGEGYRTAALERLMTESHAPANWEAVLRGFAATIDRLKALTQEAEAADPSLTAEEAFRDPERLKEAEQLVQRALAGAMTPPPGPSPAFSRSGYEVSGSNQLAAKAADAVIAEPGKRYNPLFVHGPSGVGKTHLVHAIGNELAAQLDGRIVACVSAQAFMDELIAALQDGTVDRWRTRYRNVGALLVDDVQFAAGKERTQEELFHVFNALYAEGKQLVFASDRPPKELDGLEDRLRSRFEGGLVVEMLPPDRVLREKLYARFLSASHPTAGPELLTYLADRQASSVREILGTVNRVVAAADAAGVELDVDVARAELEPSGAPHLAAPEPASVRSAADTFFLDDEKVVWDWNEVSTRVIEEMR